jgi:hypothetical protein
MDAPSMIQIYMNNIPGQFKLQPEILINLINNSNNFDSDIENVFGSKDNFIQCLRYGPQALIGEVDELDRLDIPYNEKVRQSHVFWNRFLRFL